MYSFTHWLLWISVANKVELFAPISEGCYDKPRQCFKRQRHHFANKGLYSQGYGLSSSYVQMWELLDHKEGWALKNWCFWTVVLEKTLESPLDCKQTKSVNPKAYKHWVCIERTDAEAETPTLWPPDAKSRLIGRTLMLRRIEGWKRRGQQRTRWLDGITDAVDMGLSKLQENEGQGSLVCCSP